MSLDEQIDELISEYRSNVLLASNDLTNDKSVELVALSTISTRGKLLALIADEYKRGYIDGGIGVINGELPYKQQFMSRQDIAELTKQEEQK